MGGSLNILSSLNFSVDLNNKNRYINNMSNNKRDLNVLSFKNMYFLNIGEKYLGESLIEDYGMEGGGIEENKYYVILNDGEICEVV